MQDVYREMDQQQKRDHMFSWWKHSSGQIINKGKKQNTVLIEYSASKPKKRLPVGVF